MEIIDNMGEYELLGVSEVAKLEKVTSQQIYYRIKEGIYETVNFNRGKMRGILVKYPKEKLMKRNEKRYN